MDQEKRKLMIAEIEHWRRSRLLPEQYCDFLLNLYMDDHTARPKTWFGVSKHAVKSSSWKMWFTITGIIGLISFVAFHFTSFRFEMQTGLSLLAVAALFVIGALQREKRPAVSYFSFGLGSILMLVLGLFLMDQRDITGLPVVAFIGLCSLTWMLIGIMNRMAVFHFSAWMVLFLIYAYILRQNISDIDWIGLELSWVPISIVLAWLGWLFHHVNKSIASVLLLVGLISWFGAEAYGLTATGLNGSLLQSLLFFKLVLAGAAMFALRKKWIEWVAS